MVSADRVAAINPPIDDTDPIRKFSIDSVSHTDWQKPAEFSPKGKPIRNFSIDPTSSIRTPIADAIFADAISETPRILSWGWGSFPFFQECWQAGWQTRRCWQERLQRCWLNGSFVESLEEKHHLCQHPCQRWMLYRAARVFLFFLFLFFFFSSLSLSLSLSELFSLSAPCKRMSAEEGVKQFLARFRRKIRLKSGH